MASIYILIPIALIFMALAISAYLWAVKNGQYKDLDKEAHRILFDEDPNEPNKENNDQP
jgi:cbb3-type cytochrome oxidase maturation protein